MAGLNDFFDMGGGAEQPDPKKFKEMAKDITKALNLIAEQSKKMSSSVGGSLGEQLTKQFKKFESIVKASGVSSLEEMGGELENFQVMLKHTQGITADLAKTIGETLSKGLQKATVQINKSKEAFRNAESEIKKSQEGIASHTKVIKANRAEISKALVDYSKGFGAVSSASGVTRKFGVELPNMLSNIFSKILDSGKQKSAADDMKRNMQQYLDIIKQFNSGMKTEINKANGISIKSGGGITGGKGGGARDKIDKVQKAVTGAATSFFEIFAQAQDLAVQQGRRLLDAHFVIQDAMANAGGKLGKDFSDILPEIKGQYAAIGTTEAITKLEAAKQYAKIVEAGFKNIGEEGGKEIQEIMNRMGATSTRLFVGGDLIKMMATESRMTGKKLKGAVIANLQTPLDLMRRVLSGTNIAISKFNKGISDVYETASQSMVSKNELVSISTNIAMQEGYLRRMGVDAEKSIGTMLTDITTGFKKMSIGSKAFFGMQAFGTSNAFQGANMMEFGQSIADVLAGKEVSQSEIAKKRLDPQLELARTTFGGMSDVEAQFTAFSKYAQSIMKVENPESVALLFKEMRDKGSVLGDPGKSTDLLGKLSISALSDKEKTTQLVSSATHQDKIADIQLKLQEAMLSIMTTFYLASTAAAMTAIKYLTAISKAVTGNISGAKTDIGIADLMGSSAYEIAKSLPATVNNTMQLAKELQTFTKSSGLPLTQMKQSAELMQQMFSPDIGNAKKLLSDTTLKNEFGMTQEQLKAKIKQMQNTPPSAPVRHLGGSIPRFHEGGFPGMQGMTSGAILRNDEIFLGGNVGKTGQVLSPQESKNAIGGKGNTFQFNGPIYGIPDFKTLIKQIVDQHLGTM